MRSSPRPPASRRRRPPSGEAAARSSGRYSRRQPAMSIQVSSPGWRTRSATRGGASAPALLEGLPPAFLAGDAKVSDEIVLEAAAPTRGRATPGGPLDLTVDVEPGRAVMLALRHPSGALTFHRPVGSTTRGGRG